MNHGSQFAEPDPSRHRHADFTDHLPGMACHDGCAKDFVASLPDVKLCKAVFLTVQNSAIHLLELAHISVHFQATLAGVTLVKADVSNFRVGVSAPGHRESTCFLVAKE